MSLCCLIETKANQITSLGVDHNHQDILVHKNYFSVNGIKLTASEVDFVNTMLAVASGEISEVQLKILRPKNC